MRLNKQLIRQPSSITLVLSLLLLTIAPGFRRTAEAQICNHGIGVSMSVFGTNCFGVLVPQLAHPGDFVGVRITADYNDECGNLNCSHDTYVITNFVIASTNTCLTFTTTNLVTTNGLPPNAILGQYPILISDENSSSCPYNVGPAHYTPVYITNGPFNGTTIIQQIPTNCSGRIIFSGNLDTYDTNSVDGQAVGTRFSAQPAGDLFVISPKICVGKQCTNGIGQTGLIAWS